jgi:hypothetical protein
VSIAKTHENYSADWWTPRPWLKWVGRTLGGGWFDPCPGNWNGMISGLDVDWHRRTYCNHPGSRGSTKIWWEKADNEQRRMWGAMDIVWCAFSIEQLRHMRPSPFSLPGWLVMPRERTAFVWGGKTDGKRVHGEPAKSPANWACWWTCVPPATPPVDCVIVRTS